MQKETFVDEAESKNVVIGVMSVLVQGFLLGKLLKVFSPQRLALLGLLSSTIAFVAWGVASNQRENASFISKRSAL